MSDDALLELLRRTGFRRGRFTLTSGRESDFFIDCKPAVLRAEGHLLVGRALRAALAGLPGPVGAVAGVELGGCPLASAVATVSALEGAPLDAVYVRKQAKGHGSKKQLEGADHLDGARLAILEDTVTTGGSTIRAAQTLTDAGFVVAGVLAVVDREEGAREAIEAAGHAFVSLYRRRDFMGDATPEAAP
ncbi:MAG: orotate phosphoribosyltransferase [Myxococcota bacterium]